MSQTRIENPAERGPRYRYLVLAMLILAYTFNFLDRQILGILKEPIKQELGLTDTQLGLMGGVAFAALYTTLAVPIAWLADRVSRTWIMTAALALWSAFTAACGFATGFWSLFLTRMGAMWSTHLCNVIRTPRSRPSRSRPVICCRYPTMVRRPRRAVSVSRRTASSTA